MKAYCNHLTIEESDQVLMESGRGNSEARKKCGVVIEKLNDESRVVAEPCLEVLCSRIGPSQSTWQTVDNGTSTSAKPLRENEATVENARNEQSTTHEGPTKTKGDIDGEVQSESDVKVKRFPRDVDYCRDEQLLYNLIREGDQPQVNTRGEQ